MNKVVIVSACRTAIGKYGGVFKNMNATELTIPIINALIDRSQVKKEQIEDVIWGCNYQKTYLENNLARVSAIKAGLPETVPGITVHRNCTSSMSALQLGYYQIKANEADVLIVGGTESMSNASYTLEGYRWGLKMGNTEVRDSMWDSLTHLGVGPAMGITAENIATAYNISREEQDKLSLESQEKAKIAMESNRFEDEIVPIEIQEKKGIKVIMSDENPRSNVTIEQLSKLKPTFKEGGTVTAGNSSGINDGSAGMLIMSEEKAKELNLKILAEIVSVSTVGVDPEIMGIGPVSSTIKALEKANLSLSDIELFEINEAFASQYLAVEKELGLNRKITNVNGSGISLGHPVGASGIRIMVSLVYEMKKRGLTYGLGALCAGGGMGTTVVLKAYN